MGKTTHTLLDIEGLMSELYNQLKDENLTKLEKTRVLKRLKLLEKHFNDCNDKHINGKKYPKRQIPQPVKKEEVLKLIDSEDHPRTKEECMAKMNIKGIDLSGVSVGKNRFEFVELG